MATWHEKTNRWVASKVIQGKRLWFTSKTSAEDADKQAREAQAPGPTFEAQTFAAFVYGPWKANTWPEIKPLSRVKYNGQFKNHILPILGHLRIDEIGLEEMLALKGSLRLKGKKRNGDSMHNRTAHSILTLALSVMILAKEAGKTSREDWKTLKLPKYTKKTERDEAPEGLTAALLREAEGTWMAGPLFAALFLGLRRGEVCGLKWSAIDRRKLTLRIDTQRQRQSGKGTVEADTKGKTRTLYVSEDLIAWLDRLGDKGSVYVFTGAEGFPMRPDRITTIMPKLCQAAKVEPTLFRDLRSYAASNLDALGVEITTIASILGHTKIDVTLLYVNTKKKLVRDALGRLLGAMEKTG